ncbi:MAG: sigma-70 family RNA polymerase sigma factor [Planctomycetaceae bacterium]|nr:sigma-70 family RNA polymerase sigma factor [Planctomycetaceae bacterium]
MTSAENEATLERLKQACIDDRIWGAVMEEHRSRLRAMIDVRIPNLVRARFDASDVIQEAMIDASQRLPEYIANPTVPFYVWLRALTGQRLAAAFRRHLGVRSRNAAREVRLIPNSFPSATSAAIAAKLVGKLTSPSSVAVMQERRMRLQKALEQLEEIDREILVLRHFEELSNSESAAVLGLQPTAANNRYIRALGRLKSALGAMDEEF